MRTVNKVLSNLHRYILWLLISVIFWAWLFTVLTDTVRAKKIVIYVNVPSVDEYALAEELENHMPEGIRMIKVRPAGYSGFDPSVLDETDIFILSASDIEANHERLSPVSGFGSEELLYVDGNAYGICLFDSEKGVARASAYIDYIDPDGAAARYYICFNKDSVHTRDLNASKDNAAIDVAGSILNLND